MAANPRPLPWFPTFVAMLDPDTFRPEPDLVAELSESWGLYQLSPDDKGKSVTVTHFPAYLRIALDSLRQHARCSLAPSLNLTIVCALTKSIPWFFEDDDIYSLRKIKADFARDSARARDASAVEFVSEMLRKFPLTIPGTMSRSSRTNVVMPEALYKEVHRLAVDTGIDKQDVVVLALMRVVSIQVECMPQHAKLAAQTFDDFRAKVRLMRRFAKLAVEELGTC